MYRLRIVLLAILLAIPIVGNAAYYLQLPTPVVQKSIYLDQALQQRRSVRSFDGNKQLSAAEISQLLWAAQGVTDKVHRFRTAPSAGALYPLDLYLLRNDGVWKYVPIAHKLELVSRIDLRQEIAAAAYEQKPVEEAPIDIVIVAVYQRSSKKYGKRGVRFSYLEAGHVAQNILLETEGLGLAAVPIGGFRDLMANKILKLPRGHDVVYIIPVGYKK